MKWLAPEVVQTSAMDCGPAALACLLAGHGVLASYGRLREACQTDVDGTSIDTLEDVANRLGLQAEQVMVPADHLLLGPLPALAVVRHADLATHFVVVWRRVGPWLQLMDPAVGRRWVRADRFAAELWPHRTAVPAADWRAWAEGPEFAHAMRQRLAALGIAGAKGRALLAQALARPGWRTVATLDAAVRLVQSLVTAGGVRRGDEALALAGALCRRSLADADPRSAIPAGYWAVTPLDAHTLELHGAVLLRVPGRRPEGPAAELPPELAAALAEPAPQPLRTVWQLARADGLAAPLALASAVALSAGVLALEALLFRGLFDLSALLTLASQRALAGAMLVVLLVLLLMLEAPVLAEALRQGRALESRLRATLLAKLPQLPDRWFQSRPLSDMAERAHGLQATRALPLVLLQAVQAAVETALTFAGVCWLAPASAGWALALFVVALALPLLAAPLLGERDLRLRNHAGALAGFHLDALLGAAPARAHRAQRNLARQHESLLVEWMLAARGWLRAATALDALQATLATALAGALVATHLLRAGSIGGSDLLLVFWVLKLPALGGRFAALAQQLPQQRNVLLRLLEPLGAPAEPTSAAAPAAAGAMGFAIEGGTVVAGGHTLLAGVHLRVAPGEHVAIVGASGAGKSSLLGVLLGWHRLAEGRLVVDGREQQPGDAAARRPDIAWVDPGIQLWNRSLLDNLAYAADDGAASRTGAALHVARLRALVQRLPQGLQTALGEGGSRLSGGEGQRVRLGRALVADGARLVLLDEPFRGLDRGQRHALMDDARRAWQGRTLLCVTHDVGETTAFDRVIVVDGGRIVEDGAPRQLAAAASRYRTLLQAEQRVQATLWQGGPWRRVRVGDTRLKDAA